MVLPLHCTFFPIKVKFWVEFYYGISICAIFKKTLLPHFLWLLIYLHLNFFFFLLGTIPGDAQKFLTPCSWVIMKYRGSHLNFIHYKSCTSPLNYLPGPIASSCHVLFCFVLLLQDKNSTCCTIASGPNFNSSQFARNYINLYSQQFRWYE